MTLCDAIGQLAVRHKRCYGYRRVTLELRKQGVRVNHKKVFRLMREMDVQARVRPKKYRSYKDDIGMAAAPYLLRRKFNVSGPGVKLVTDVTEFNVGGDKLYLSPVMDLYNAEIIAMSIGTRPTFDLTEKMLNDLLTSGYVRNKAILHSDQGWQYRMPSWQKRLKEAGIRQSMSRKGNCYDNAAMESFFAVLKTEMFHGYKFENREKLAESIEAYVAYYNHDRIKMKLGGMSPADYRTQMFPLH
jgi:transposase InsO family protein